jgi:uncharacterized membrane protein
MTEPVLPEQNNSAVLVNRRIADRRIGPTKHDEIVNDILKHLTTLNTGLLAILAAFSQHIQTLLQSYPSIGSAFVYSFYVSLLFCMTGFILSVVSLQRLTPRRRSGIKLLRDMFIVVAVLGYIAALMFLVTLYSSPSTN